MARTIAQMTALAWVFLHGHSHAAKTSDARWRPWLQQLQSRQPARVARAKKRLLKAGSAALPAIVKAFATPSLRARKRLLTLLRPNKVTLAALAHAIRRGKGAQRSGAMYALTSLMRHPPPKLMRLLLWRLRRGPWYVRGAAAYALSRARPTPRVRRALLRALTDHSWRVKGNAAEGLKRAGQRAHKALRKAQSHPHWTVQATAGAILTPPAHRHATKTSTRPKGQTLRVLTYNICHGAGMDGSYSLARVAAVMRRHKADIIGLQEVDHGTRRSLRHHQLVRLGKMLKMHAIFGPAIAFQGGRFGNGLLSKYPIVKHRIHKLKRLGGWEPRTIIDATISLPGKRTIRVFNTHLDNRSAKARAAAVAALKALIGSSRQPALLIGDLNASPGSPTLKALGRQWTNPLRQHPLASMPATVPIFQIDYVLYRPAQSWHFRRAIIDSSAQARLASDHRPLLVTLTLPHTRIGDQHAH